ncbi:mitochondrial carrier [Fragilariopsis cylindrus CCMP1102]|uniref:Mitochondrial carrier n=1 Tax=Fragilariopsis cylindrus CCMP1102 TaxID=635003 RepID=A0A1E7FE54_9STRA|nr:mitochondrial carrier [Fragilariopsis cylindrus CCMP1102]|eukprot:OEU16416.1 mitochondrial carrier [Fragilariopsis cylindrus CCMP1102]
MDQKQIVGSTVAGISSTVLGHPLDTIKTHLQTNPKLHNNSFNAFKKLQLKGIFRGITPPLVNAIIMNTVMFTVFDKVQTKVNNNSFISGIISGFATAIISTPTDYIKIQMQLSSLSLSSTLSSILGVTSIIGKLYRGFTVNLAREGIFTMVYLGIYHWILQKEEILLYCNSNNNNSNNFNHIVFVTGTSAFTGALAWMITYPFDLIKTMIQSGSISNHNSSNHNFSNFNFLRKQIQTMYTNHGLKIFYRGCIPSTGRAMLVTSSRMLAYDQVMIRYNNTVQ